MAKTYDKRGTLYNEGDENRCPTCGAQLGGYDNLEFMDGGIIQLTNGCHKCGHYLVFNYYLNNVIDEDAEE